MKISSSESLFIFEDWHANSIQWMHEKLLPASHTIVIHNKHVEKKIPFIKWKGVQSNLWISSDIFLNVLNFYMLSKNIIIDM